MRRIHWALLFVLAVSVGLASADVKLPAVIGDNMVLQRDIALPLWGWATPGDTITVTFAGQTKTATAGQDGKWQVTLDPLKASGKARTLTVQSKIDNRKSTIANVLVGEVWVCSGQSNMAMGVSRAANAEQEMAAAEHPNLRLFSFPKTPATTPQTECPGEWAPCSPETVGVFSATAYYFGRHLHKTLGVPVGLINTSWGGTPVEAWISRAAHLADPDLKTLVDTYDASVKRSPYDAEKAKAAYEKRLAAYKEARKAGKAKGRASKAPVDPATSQRRPGNLYNGMIHPLIPYGIRGGIWYQGEANSHPGKGKLYHKQLSALIADWRGRWGQGDFPFLWVQLPNFKTRQDDPNARSEWAVTREGMMKTLRVPNTAMAITIDIGEAKNIHPENKQDVGKRLAIGALKIACGRDICPMGPIYASCKVEGGKIRVSFDYVGKGLVAKGGELKGFAIAGADKTFVWADAKIDGESVVVSSDKVAKPAAVRYAWGDNPDCNLVNAAGLPASPFRTDDWPVGEPIKETPQRK